MLLDAQAIYRAIMGYPDEAPAPPARKDEQLTDKVHWLGL